MIFSQRLDVNGAFIKGSIAHGKLEIKQFIGGAPISRDVLTKSMVEEFIKELEQIKGQLK